MNTQQIDRIVREANPIPDLDVLDPPNLRDLEEAFDEGDLKMVKTRQHTESKNEEVRYGSRRQKYVMAIAVAAAIALVVLVESGVGSVRTATEEPIGTAEPNVPLETEAQALALATGFVEARSRGLDGLYEMLSYLDGRAEVGWGIGSGPGTLDETLEWEEAFQLSYSPEECVVSSPANSVGEVGIRCTVTQHSAVAEVYRPSRLGFGPQSESGNGLEPAVVDFVVRGDLITKITFDSGNFMKAAWHPFRTYIIQKHRADVGRYFTSGPDGWPPRPYQSDLGKNQGFIFWKLRVDEFIDYHENPPPAPSLTFPSESDESD